MHHSNLSHASDNAHLKLIWQFIIGSHFNCLCYVFATAGYWPILLLLVLFIFFICDPILAKFILADWPPCKQFRYVLCTEIRHRAAMINLWLKFSVVKKICVFMWGDLVCLLFLIAISNTYHKCIHFNLNMCVITIIKTGIAFETVKLRRTNLNISPICF